MPANKQQATPKIYRGHRPLLKNINQIDETSNLGLNFVPRILTHPQHVLTPLT